MAVAVAADAIVVIKLFFDSLFTSEVWVHPPRFFILFLVFGPVRMKETKETHIEVEGVVAQVLPGTMFRVELDNKHLVLATVCGKMRKRWVRITTGDRVKMEMSPYDLNKARITWRVR